MQDDRVCSFCGAEEQCEQCEQYEWLRFTETLMRFPPQWRGDQAATGD